MSAIVVKGRLSADAHTMSGTDQSAWVRVEIGMVGTGKEVVASQRIGEGHACQYIASTKAKALRKGAEVAIHAGGFEICLTPHQHLVLVGVSLIEHLDHHDHRTPREREAQTA